MELKIGHVAFAHPVFQLGTNPAARGGQAVHRAYFGFGAAIHLHIHLRRFAAGVEQHLRDVRGGDARVGKVAQNHGIDFLTDRFGDAVLVVLAGSLFRHGAETPTPSLQTLSRSL